jgi:acetyl coenzyme A synthetase (ADP forming)-like protein
MTPELAPFFEPRTIAVIGASRDPSKVGGSVIANLRSAGFEGRVIPVNPAASEVQGLPAVASVLDIDGAIDLAVLAVPAPAVLPALEACAVKHVPGAVVISAGFRESDDAGRVREAELRAWLAGRSLRILGPNCLGWIRPSRRLNLTFAPGMPASGPIAFISHSGAIAVGILDWARDRRMGFSLFASLGNQADLSETDLLQAVAADPESRVIVAYLEGVADGRRFFEALRAAVALKPVVLLKAGRSAEGARAVSSHTGALAGSDAAFDAAVSQAGAVRVRTIEELFDLARALGSQPLPRGRRLLAVTNGGGLGIVATDAARGAGLEMPPTPGRERQRLRAVLPPAASVGNPIDLVGDADAARFSRALHALRGVAGIDALLILLTAQAATDSVGVARAIIGATRGWDLCVAAALVGGPRVSPGAAALEEAGIPCFPFPERAVAALSGMATLADRRRSRPEAPPPRAPGDAIAALEELRADGAAWLGMAELAPVLERCGIPAAPGALAATAEDAAQAAARLGFPVAVKIVSPDITHKSDVGGVRLGLSSAADVVNAVEAMLARARAELPRAAVRGVLVQQMVRDGRELLLGALRDPQFGPLVMVGFGGLYVEVLRDTAARLAPVSPGEALGMLDELRMAKLLAGARGEPPVDRSTLADVISRFARLVADCEALVEIEINPLIAGPGGAIAVDARATLAAARPAPHAHPAGAEARS